MAEATTAGAPEVTDEVVDVKLLGPAQEFSPPGVQLAALPVSTTIAQLKARIAETVASHPPAETLRIISHGRACKDNEQLSDIFARTPAQHDSTFRILHVVVTDPSLPRPAHLLPPRSQSVPSSARSSQRHQHDPLRAASPQPLPPSAQLPRLSQLPQPVNTHIHAQPAQHARSVHQIHQQVPENVHQPHAHPPVPGPQLFNPAEIMNGLFNQQVMNQHFAALQGQLPQLLQQLPPFANHAFGVPVVPREQGPREQTHNNLDNRQPQEQERSTSSVSRETDTASVEANADVQNASSSPSQEATTVHAHHFEQTEPLAPTMQPATPTQHITSVDANGRQFTVTMQNSVFNVPTNLHGTQLPMHTFGSQFSEPQVPAHGQFTTPLQASSSNGPTRPLSTPLPDGPSRDGNAHAPTDMRNANGQLDHRLLHLSANLFNISRQIQMLGGRLSTPRAQTASQGTGLRDAMMYLRALDELELLLRGFDNASSQLLAIYPQAQNHPQYMQTQTRRAGAGAALARIYEVVRTEFMPSMLRPTSIPTAIPTNSAQPTHLESLQEYPTEAQDRSQTSIPSSSATPQIYVLNDPSGAPYALLVGPQGQHTSQPLPWNILQPLLAAHMPAMTLARAIHQITSSSYAQTFNSVRFGAPLAMPQLRLPVALPDGRDRTLGDVLPGNALHNGETGPANAQEIVPPQPAREPDEMRDLLAPVIRNLWLLLRIAGFAYFLFGGGRALRRPLMLAGILTIVWAAQAGLFGDRFDAIRRYLDRLVGVEPANRAAPTGHEEQVPSQAQNAPTNHVSPDNDAQPEGSQAGNGTVEPRIEAAAVRLRMEHQARREGTWLLQQVRYIERMFGLFLASLWPGIGEQAVRLQEERQRRLREEAEQARAATEAAALDAQHQQPAGILKAEHDAREYAPAVSTSTDAIASSPAEKADGESLPSSSSAVGVSAGDGDELRRVNKGKGRAVEQ